MKNLFNPKNLNSIIGLLITTLAIKILWFTVEILWLPTTDINQERVVNNKALYYHIKLISGKVAPKKSIHHIAKRVSENIKDIKLLAIYSASDTTVVTVEYRGKTKVLQRGDSIRNFTLENAGLDFAIFSRGSNEYKLTLDKGKDTKDSITLSSSSTKNIENSRGDVIDDGDHKVVNRNLVNYYSTNIKEIDKNIGLDDFRKNGRLNGFRVSFVRSGTPFAKLGLKRGDIIKSINGEKMNSYSAALNIYNHIKSIDNLTLVIERRNKEMELEYEID